MEEETLLQYHGRLPGAKVDRTPKCHPELAGEGIEYAWGCAKGFYRRIPLAQKRYKNLFFDAVRQCLDAATVLTVERVCRFLRQAREYVKAYSQLEAGTDNGAENAVANGAANGAVVERGQERRDSLAVSEKTIEKMVKTYRTHRCAFDFDRAYINSILSQGTNHGVGAERVGAED